jgi:NTE family protein
MRLLSPKNPRIGLALQGGGAHGAFTWGVLDALLEDEQIDFEGISGTSAGAINAVVLAHGLLEDGREGARAALNTFWEGVASKSPPGFPSVGEGDAARLTPATRMLLHWSRYFSPQQMNPFDINPLRDLLSAQVDFERLRAESKLKLFVAATHANSGKLRLFGTRELTVDALLASACLPTISRSVEIDGEPYWDGGFSANPAVFPLINDCNACDILLVLLAPQMHAETPSSAEDIRTRTLDLAFNATFLREMRRYARASENASRSLLPGNLERRLRRTRFHVIQSQDHTAQLASETRVAPTPSLLRMLRDRGRDMAHEWLDRHRLNVGKRSTTDIREMFI